MIAELARFSLGRILLHFIAMPRDGAVRFHAAGIARELSWVVGGAAPLLARVHAGLIGALALYLTQPGKRYRPLTTGRAWKTAATRSGSRRRLTSSAVTADSAARLARARIGSAAAPRAFSSPARIYLAAPSPRHGVIATDQSIARGKPVHGLGVPSPTNVQLGRDQRRFHLMRG